MKTLAAFFSFRHSMIIALLLGLAGSSCGPSKIEVLDNEIIASGLVANRSKLWPNGSRLRVKFLNGNADRRALVRRLADNWTRYANLNFVWVEEGPAEIRVSFTSAGNNSTLGTDALKRPNQSQETMSLGSLGMDPIKRDKIILHEFGHAIGLEHEHLSPNSEIVLDREKVTRECRMRYGFTPEVCENAIFKLLQEDVVDAFEFDPHSVMNYFFHESHYANHSPRTRIIGRLSLGDKLGISQVYPGRIEETAVMMEQLEEDKSLMTTGKCRVLKDVCERGRYTVQYKTIFGNDRRMDFCTAEFYEAVSLMLDESKCR